MNVVRVRAHDEPCMGERSRRALRAAPDVRARRPGDSPRRSHEATSVDYLRTTRLPHAGCADLLPWCRSSRWFLGGPGPENCRCARTRWCRYRAIAPSAIDGTHSGRDDSPSCRVRGVSGSGTRRGRLRVRHPGRPRGRGRGTGRARAERRRSPSGPGP